MARVRVIHKFTRISFEVCHRFLIVTMIFPEMHRETVIYNIPVPTNPSSSPKRSLPPEILARCRDLRRNHTNAESYLWLFLRNRGLKNVKFRRQHPIGPYVLDFYCHESKLAIEVDGSGHLDETQARHDSLRTEYLLQQGIRVLRFFNNQVLGDVEGVLSVIWEELPE